MSDLIVIGVDTGNRCIKTAHHSFTAGIKVSEQSMPFQQGVLEYNNKYYMLSQDRVAYLQDKTLSDEYFVMTLFAIIKELEIRGVDTNQVIRISLGVGLPPSHLSRLKNRFQSYFDRGMVTFMYNKHIYRIEFCRINVFSQGYSAIYKDFNEIKKFNKSYIIDIGGYTTDIISLNNGLIDPAFCQSLDMGLIHLYNKINWIIQSKYGFAPTESQIEDMIISGKEIITDVPIIETVNKEAKKYISEMMRKLTEYGIELRFSRGIFVGGGACRFRTWIEQSEFVSQPYFIDNINANAQGYEAFLQSLNAL